MRPLFLFLLAATLCSSALLGAEKRRLYPVPQQTVIYSGPKDSLPKTTQDNPEKTRWYIGLRGIYATGEQTLRTQLGESIYREDRYDVTGRDVGMILGFGGMGSDRIEMVVSPSRSFSYTDSTHVEEFSIGRGLDLSYYFVMDVLYQKANPSNIVPYIKMGVGISQFDIEQSYSETYDADTILANDYFLGFGSLFQLGNRVSVSAAYLVTYREFQSIESGSYEKRITQRLNALEVSLQYHF